MTQKEIKLTQENKELKQRLKAKAHEDKPLFKTKYFTTTKINVHFGQVIAVIIIGFCMYMCRYLVSDTIQLAVVLSALIGCGGYILKKSYDTYSMKSIADSEQMNKKEKYKMRFDFAQMMTTLVAKKKITPEAVPLFKSVIEENSTSVAVNGYGGSTVVDSTTFGVTNPNVDNQYQYNAGNSEDIISSPATDNMAQG